MHSVMLGLRRAAANIAGGTHHAFSGHGEGFCEVLSYLTFNCWVMILCGFCKFAAFKC
jgi:hypothetical protein